MKKYVYPITKKNDSLQQNNNTQKDQIDVYNNLDSEYWNIEYTDKKENKLKKLLFFKCGNWNHDFYGYEYHPYLFGGRLTKLILEETGKFPLFKNDEYVQLLYEKEAFFEGKKFILNPGHVWYIHKCI